MRWYHYSQNNSGGSFVQNDSVGEDVFIEAKSAKHANFEAEQKGLYFDGDGDCPCCGNRWHEAWRDADVIEFPATVPSGWRNDDPATECNNIEEYAQAHINRWGLEQDAQAVIHYDDGRKVIVKKQAR